MDALLSQNDRMEALSRAYVSAIAAHAGYTVGNAQPDRDSVDIILNAGGVMRPAIGVQLKATTTVSVVSGEFSFPLPVKNYNDLRVPTQSPRILVVLALPGNDDEWLTHRIDKLIMKRCAYWKSLFGMPETNNIRTVSVNVDAAQIFDVAALVSLMQKSRNGESL